MRAPYLIQRLNFRNNKFKNAGDMDTNYICQYMGAAEFEWGALPDSLKRMLKNTLIKTQLSQIKNSNNEMLQLVSAEPVTDEYIESMLKMRDKEYPEMRLKEVTYFKQNSEQNADIEYLRVDVWWDIKNDVMFCYGEQAFENLLIALENTKITFAKFTQN